MKRTRPTNAASPAFAKARSDGVMNIDFKRRQTVVVSALLCAMPSLAFPAVAPVGSLGETATESDEVALAMTFLQNRYYRKLPIVYSPVSLLQRQFRLGYGNAMALASELEQIGFWQIDEPQPQQRVARLNAAFSSECDYLAV